MLYGLTGSSGTGKTTLAKAVAESLGIIYMPASITECANKHGFNSVGALSLIERLQLQMHLLEDHAAMLDAAPRPLIVDRTPIDFIGYMLAEVDMHSHMRASAEQLALVERYVSLCLDTAARNYDFIFMVGQLPSYEPTPTRPALNRAYQTHSQLIMEGAIGRLQGRVNFAFVRTTDLEERETCVHDIIVQRLDKIEREKRSSAHIH